MSELKNNSTVIVFGFEGMLGNAVFRYLRDAGLNVIGTCRREDKNCVKFDAEKFNEDDLEKIINKYQPQFIINCIGFIRPDDTSISDFKKAILINAVFPKKIDEFCVSKNIRFINFSTDCVFSGKNGPYTESTIPDESGIYGLSKYLGETSKASNITIRTSLIGKEISSKRNLLDWFLAENGSEVNGYCDVFWNGITTITAAKIVYEIISKNLKFKKPVIQIGSNTISKYDLLNIFREIFDKKIIINKFCGKKSNKTLVPSDEQFVYFSKLIPNLREQIKELKKFYE